MTSKKLAMTALFAVAMLLATTTQGAFAEKSTTTANTNGKLIPSKHQPKITAQSSSSGTVPFNWNDCLGNYKNGWFIASLPNTPTNQLTYKWSWPSYEDGGSTCTYLTFQSVEQFFQDVPQGWTVNSALETAYSNTNGKTYSIVDNNGNPLDVQTGDTVKAWESACYTAGTFCDDGRTYYSSAWIAG